MYLYLKPSDIANFSFRYPVFIHDSYYLVNKIDSYDPNNPAPVRVELLRLAYVTPVVTENIIIWQDGEGATTGDAYTISLLPSGLNPNGTGTVSDGIVSGSMNQVNGSISGIIGGWGNQIGNIQETN
jgi:hypothetical protein